MRQALAAWMLGLVLATVPVATALGGPGGDVVAETTGKVTQVDQRQHRLRLADGTELYATDSRYLDGVREGSTVHVRYEIRAGRNIILRIEPAGQ